jgi:peptidoglycan/LPS O-acetylase OafA/YrhL
MNILTQPLETTIMHAPKKYQFVDALRGWAILGVILVHTSQAFYPYSNLLGKIANDGQYGVQLFYLVSAFTLFSSFTSRQQEPNAILNFFIRRFFRIAPLFYCAIAFYLWKDGLEPRFWAPGGIKGWYILSSIFFLNGWHPASINSVVPGGWSIAVEMNFYLFIPILYKLINSVHKAISSTFIFLVLGFIFRKAAIILYKPFFPAVQHGLVDAFASQYSLPAQASVFCVGFIFYFLFKDINTCASQRKGLSVLWLMISLYLMCATLNGGFTLIPKYFIYALAFLSFSYSAALHPNILVVNPVLCFMGKVSYSLYLIHFAVIDMCKQSFPVFIFSNPEQNNYIFIIAFLLVLFLSALLSCVSFKLIEQPGQLMGKYFILWLQKAKT